MSTMWTSGWAGRKQDGLRYHSGITRHMQVAMRAICGLAALLLLATMAAAQSSSQLNGDVTDPSGAAVASAKITLTATATGLERTTASNAAGLYQFLDVPPGDYRLDISARGFAVS
jgi:hypothetical protein